MAKACPPRAAGPHQALPRVDRASARRSTLPGAPSAPSAPAATASGDREHSAARPAPAPPSQPAAAMPSVKVEVKWGKEVSAAGTPPDAPAALARPGARRPAGEHLTACQTRYRAPGPDSGGASAPAAAAAAGSPARRPTAGPRARLFLAGVQGCGNRHGAAASRVQDAAVQPDGRAAGAAEDHGRQGRPAQGALPRAVGGRRLCRPCC